MKTLASFLAGLPTAWKALMALGGAVAFGVALGSVGVSMTNLPAQVQVVRDSVAVLSERMAEDHAALDRIDRQYGRIICLLTLPGDVRARVADSPILLQRECP